MYRVKPNLVRHSIAALAATLLSAGMYSGAAIAAQADEAVEEIVVQGIRGSMEESLDRKREADRFVDAITAEDIGAFPDQNLAEALQRVSGVSIDRKEGEGAFASVRGLGPQFVQGTLNGRVVTSNTEGGDQGGSISGNSHSGSRAVAYDQYQVGLVNAVEVHKSPRANDVEGGLGGVINIETRRPLDLGERKIVFSGDVTDVDLADDIGTGIFGLYSDLLSDTIGVMISAQYDDRPARSDGLTFYGHTPTTRTYTVGGQTLTGYHVSQFNGVARLLERERTNVSGALQWRPSDRVNVNVDVLYTNQDLVERELWLDFRIDQGLAGNITAGSVQNGLFNQISTRSAGVFVQDADESGETETLTYGAEVDFQVTDKLDVQFDFSISNTESPIHTRRALMRNRTTQMTYTANGPTGVPSLTTSSPVTNSTWYEVVLISDQLHLVDDELLQFRTDATYKIDGDWLDSVGFGARWEERDRGDRHRYLTSNAFTNRPVAELGGTVPFPRNSFLDGIVPAGIPIPNLDTWHQAFTTRAAEVAAGTCNRPPAECSLAFYRNLANFPEDLNHDADTIALYAMADFSGELGDVPYSGNVGARYVETDTVTAGLELEFLGADFTDPTQPRIRTGNAVFGSASHKYSEVLPSVNVKFDLRDDLILRASVAKVLSRPSFSDLNPRTSFAPISRQIFDGNPTLDPTTAVQFDLALEWYLADYSLASMGIFRKDIEGLVQIALGDRVFPDIVDPETRRPLVLQERKPVNSADSDLTGVEMAFQHTFANLPAPFNGLGVIANYTFIDSSSDFRSSTTSSAFTIPGLSRSTVNATVFYEDEKFSARASYNRRSDFIDVLVGTGGHPRLVDEYHQVDAQLSYFWNDKVSFSLEGTNLTDESVVNLSLLGPDALKGFRSISNSGRRYQLGVLVKF